MTTWNDKKCGNCGFVASGDPALPKVKCVVCGTDMCPSCYGGVPKGVEGEMCKSCAYKDPRTKAFMREVGLT